MLPYAALVSAVVIWGLSFPVMKFAVSRMGPFDVGFCRIAFGVVGSLGLLALAPLPAARRSGAAIRRHVVTLLILSLLVGYGQTFTLTYGLALTPAATASLIPPLNPICTLLLASWFLSERVGARQWLGVSLAGAGVVLLAFRDGSPTWESVVGPLILAVAPISWAWYTVLSKPVLGDIGPFALTALTLVGGLMVLLPWARWETVVRLGQATAGEWAAVLYLGLFAMALAYALWYVGLSRIGAAATGASALGIPLVGVAGSWAFLGEAIGWIVVAAGGLIIGGLHLVLRERHA